MYGCVHFSNVCKLLFGYWYTKSIYLDFQNTELSKFGLTSETMLTHFQEIFSGIDFLSSYVILSPKHVFSLVILHNFDSYHFIFCESTCPTG